MNAVEKGRKIHGRIHGSSHLIGDVRICTAVVDFYCKCGFVEETFQVFDEMPERDLVLWNAMISGFVGCGCFREAIGLFRIMRNDGFRANSRTLVQLLLACQGVLELRLGKEVHGRSSVADLYELTRLVQFRLAYVAPESRVVGAGELVDHHLSKAQGKRTMGSSGDNAWKLADHTKLLKGRMISMIVLHGWGEANPDQFNCIHIAETPTMDSFKQVSRPRTTWGTVKSVTMLLVLDASSLKAPEVLLWPKEDVKAPATTATVKQEVKAAAVKQEEKVKVRRLKMPVQTICWKSMSGE
ncbi:Pentatricopeptide repeat-containing protein At3g16610 [Linum perenne]